jgi:SanA protein
MAPTHAKTGIRWWRRLGWIAVVVLFAGPDVWVLVRGAPLVRTLETLPSPDVLLVPGASVLRNGRPSPVLRQRVETALGAARRWPGARIVLSGTAVPGGYDEPRAMRKYLVDHGVDSSRMVLDREGTSTRSSVADLGTPRGALAIVSQEWHLPRACWLARKAGWDVHGLAAGTESAAGWENILREHLTRTANFWEWIFRSAHAQVVSFPPTTR